MVKGIALLKQLENKTLSQAFNEYMQMINELECDKVKDTVMLLIKNSDNEDLLQNLLISTINKTSSLAEGQALLSQVLSTVLNTIKRFENPISTLFQLLECFTQKKDEIARFKILEVLMKFEFNVINIVNLMYKADIDALVLDILKSKEAMIDDFIRNSIMLDNPNVAKNLALVLPNLGSRFFSSYNSFLFLFESENHHLRNCLLDILQGLVQDFKKTENIEAISEITQHISERLLDVNFYVRSKALSVIGELFKKECILKDQRNSLIKEITERAKDKTVIVRKKSIGLLTQLLINHPFKDKNTLERLEKRPKSGSESQKRVIVDFEEFVALMETALSVVISLLDHTVKTDLIEISDFVKVSYLLKLQGSREAIQKMLCIVFTKDKQVVIDVFKEILTERGDILYEFINDKAFEAILGSLDLDEKLLWKNIFNNNKLFESVYILRQSQKPVSEESAYMLLQNITEILFRSKDELELEKNIQTYVNMLCILKRMKHRAASESDIFTLIIKNLIKMVFYEPSVIKHTVEVIYCTSVNPEYNAGKLLKSLCLTKSTLKIVDAVGCIALNQFYLLERLEVSIKSQKNGKALIENSSIRKSLDDFREKRKSLEEARRSSLSRISLDRTTSLMKKRLSLRFEELEASLKDKSDEEVADFFFYLKEHEILYSKESMLHQLVPLVVSSLKSANPTVQAVAHTSLFKCMLISSDFFNENKCFFIEALNSPLVNVRNTAITAFHDFLIFFNMSVDSSALFEKLNDREINKNAMLVVFSLLQKNIIRLKNNAVCLASHLFDESLGHIVKTLVKQLSSNNNTISILFYEAYKSNLSIDIVKYLAGFVAPLIHESLFLKCLKNTSDMKGNGDIERLKAVFSVFEITEKFVKENIFREEMKQILGQADAL
ncbi:meiotic chromosome condensation [Glugoides intestinalis]